MSTLTDEIAADRFLLRTGLLNADPSVPFDKEYVLAQVRLAFCAGWGACMIWRDDRGDGEGRGYRRQDDYPSLTAGERNETLR